MDSRHCAGQRDSALHTRLKDNRGFGVGTCSRPGIWSCSRPGVLRSLALPCLGSVCLVLTCP